MSCYGDPGETCRVEGCGTVLRQTNPYDVCSRCLGRGIKGRKRPPRRGGVPATACSEAAPTASLVPRHHLGEEIDMAAEQRRKYGKMKEAVIACMADGEWRGSPQVAAHCGIAQTAAKYHLQSLTENGHLESAGKGGRGYRLRQDAAAKAADQRIATQEFVRAHASSFENCVPDASASSEGEESAKEAPTAPPAPREQVPAPATPAEATPDPAPSGPESSAGFLPFAGLSSYFEGHGYSRAVRVLMELDEMPAAERESVLQFAVSTWWLK